VIVILVQYSFTVRVLLHVVVGLSLKEFQKMVTIILKLHSSASEHHFIESSMGSTLLVYIPANFVMLVSHYFQSESATHIALIVAVSMYAALRIHQFITYVHLLHSRGKEMYEKDPFLERKAFVLAFLHMSADVFGFIIFAFPLNYALLMLSHKEGLGFILLWLIAAWQTDNGALFIGSLIGKNPFSSLVSPKKTWEGVSGGIFLSVVSTLIFSLFKSVDTIYVPNISTKHYLIMSLMIAVVSIFGDFLESFIKRAANLKDSGNLLPGHGGMLDRMDSLALTAPIVYFYAKLVLGIF